MYVRLGLAPGGGGAWLLPRIVGLTHALDLILSGEPIDAQTALSIGLVSRVVPAKDLLRDARDTAAKIAEKAPLAVRAAKEAVNRAFEGTLADGIHFERRMFHSLFATEDQKIGMQAFIDKQKPQFKQR